ncbi:hypothetical protein [Mesorhizobium silamurunense]|uniref:hypothetical protein n=1 Tax=Mesorhizobium silamurunense TaxID=499528 RepID=UPI00177AB240|nr:hypothetical protein [Mesorhizobium silamurunense]
MLEENSSHLLLPSKTSNRTCGHIRDPVRENGFEFVDFLSRLEVAPPVITDAYNWARNDYGGLAERASAHLLSKWPEET